MTKEQVSSLYPDGTVNLTADCRAKIGLRFGKYGLEGVGLSFGEFAIGRDHYERAVQCQKIVRASILERYGDPDEVTKKKGQTVLSEGTYAVWHKENLQITLFINAFSPITSISYRYLPPVKEVSPDAAAKL